MAEKNFNKVFCIGFSKTGTSSLHELFQRLGLASLHDCSWARITNEKSVREIRDFFEPYDAFSDSSLARLDLLYAEYPKSKYILNTRGLKDWMSSRIRHIFRFGPQGGKGLMALEYLENPSLAMHDWIETRQRYYRIVQQHFKDRPDDLLIVNVCRDKAWIEKVLSFLGYEYSEDLKEPIVENVSTPKVSQEFLEKHYSILEQVLLERNIPKEQWEGELVVDEMLS